MASKLPLPNDDNVAKAPASLRAAAGKTIEKINQSDGDRVEVENLVDAMDAGGVNSQKCTLILVEGESAKKLAMSGRAKLGRQFYNVFPLKGKLLNVKKATTNKIAKNKEIESIKRILGLKDNIVYNDASLLRYGRLMLFTDQDYDGSHIKGLVISFIHSYWPKLLEVPSFLVQFITPIFTATHQTKGVKSFYSVPAYEGWRKKLRGDVTGWTIRYLKGLGSTSSEEGKAYFDKPNFHKKVFVWKDEKDGQAIELAFSPNKTQARKSWLLNYKPGTHLDLNKPKITYSDFVHNELILFSIANLRRCIPSIVDGLKPSQRKILFGAFKTNVVEPTNVYLFSCDVAKLSAYRHSVECLASTIITMAHDYVGSNNVNLFQPVGQFCKRTSGGKDPGNPRYLSIELSPSTRVLFPKDDHVLLYYLNEEGFDVEPTWYMPIIPTVLVNGAFGIGTGWSTSIPNYNPREIVANIRHLILDEPMEPMSPWFRGFKGSIEKSGRGSYTTTGICKVVNETTLQITELPIGTWTEAYRKFLESMKADNGLSFIQSIDQKGDDTTVDFDLILGEQNMLAARREGFLKKFKLTTTIPISNMYLFNKEGGIKKYATPEEILQEFFHHRLEYYKKRKQFMHKNMNIKLGKLKNEPGDLELSVKDFTENLENAAEGTAYYNRCLKRSVEATKTLEKVRAQIDEIEKAFEDLKKDTSKSLWLKDLKAFDMELDKLDKQEKEKLDEQEKEREVAQEKIRHAFEYYDKDETIVAHIAGGIDAVLKVPDGWPLRNTTLTLASLKNSDNQSKGISLSLLGKVEELANSLDLKTRQNLSSFIDTIEKILVQQTRDELHSNEFSPKNITTVASNSAMDTAEVVKPEGRQGAKKKAPAAQEVEEDDTLDVKQGLAQYNFGSAPGDSSKTTETSKAISLDDDDDEDVVVEVAPAKKGGRKPAASKAAKPPADPRKRGNHLDTP